MKKLLFLACILTGTVSFAQTDVSTKYAPIINAKSLHKHLAIVAGAEMEGRETGTEGQRKAAAYIESQFKAIGLKPVDALKGYQQFYPLYQDSLKRAELTVGKKEAVYGTDFITQLNSNESGKFKGNKIVFAGYGIDDEKYSDYTGLDVKDKIVIIFLGEPKKDGKFFLGSNPARSSAWSFPGIPKKVAAAAAKGAKGVLLVSPSQETFNQRAVDNGKKNWRLFPFGQSRKK